MQEIRIFICFSSIRSEVQHAFFLINIHDVLAMKTSGRDLVAKVSISIIQIKMRPAIAFAPLDDLIAIVHDPRSSYFNISIQPFRYQRLYISTVDIDRAEIDAF